MRPPPSPGPTSMPCARPSAAGSSAGSPATARIGSPGSGESRARAIGARKAERHHASSLYDNYLHRLALRTTPNHAERLSYGRLTSSVTPFGPSLRKQPNGITTTLRRTYTTRSAPFQAVQHRRTAYLLTLALHTPTRSAVRSPRRPLVERTGQGVAPEVRPESAQELAAAIRPSLERPGARAVSCLRRSPRLDP